MVELSLNKLKNDPIYFSENILGFQLHKGQKQILACKDRFIAVRAARRFGKSQCFAAYATWMAATNDNCRIVCVSKSKRQADELFQKIYQFIIHSILVEYLTRNTLSRIEFSNGSVIESLPSRTPDSLRGPTIHLILIDEAAYCDNSLFESIYPTILNVKGKTLGKLVMISSPRFKSGEFYKAFEPGSIFTPFHFTHEDAVFDDGSRLLPEEELEREAQRCGGRDTAYFKREYLAEFGNSDDAFFDTEGIDAALKPEFPQISFGIPGHKYVIGADLAQTQDYSVFIVLDYTKRDNLKVVHTCRFKGKNAPEIEKALYK
jgi:phage terminase large subunit-like protein